MGRKDRSAKRRDIEARLASEGWIVVRVGPGDHVQYRHPERTGRVTIDRAVASAWKRTLATLPTSPSSVGIICISADVSPPGLIVPSDHTSSPPAPCDAGGAVPSRRVPRGTRS